MKDMGRDHKPFDHMLQHVFIYDARSSTFLAFAQRLQRQPYLFAPDKISLLSKFTNLT